MVEVGNILYEVVYWSISGRKLETMRVKRVTKNYIITKYDWKIARSRIGKNLFLTKREAIIKAIENHEEFLHKSAAYYDHKAALKEIAFLKGWLKRAGNQPYANVKEKIK